VSVGLGTGVCVFFGHFFSFYFFSGRGAWNWGERLSDGVYTYLVRVVGVLLGRRRVGGTLYGWRANGQYACIHTHILLLGRLWI
jgi:hypothetical protein